ncbi:MAG: phenylalanine--tRNA ligase subunit alpha [Candidatus Bathyarchaeia archaeon]
MRLHRLEKILLKALNSGAKSFRELASETGLPESSVSRAAFWLVSKGYAEVKETRRVYVELGPEGKTSLERGIPERLLTKTVLKRGLIDVSEVYTASGLSKEEVALAIGWARKKGWIQIQRVGGSTVLKASVEPEKGKDELLLEFLSQGRVPIEAIPPELSSSLSQLRDRPNFIVLQEEADRSIALTSAGRSVLDTGIDVEEELSQVTPELLLSGAWRGARFRRYDIQAPVVAVWPGKKHPFRRFLDEVKVKLIAMGFKEMTGPIVELMFFNCDALFMPQDHPAREIHDIYYLKNPVSGTLCQYEDKLRKVKATHENGWTTGSTGWGYRFSEKESKRMVLRSQGTAVSARMLASKELEIPGKYFSISRVYRPDVVDRTHLTEFHHLEGIVVSEELSFRSLLGILETFAVEVAGAEKVKFRPDYFPFTEPSVELSAYKEGSGWLEFGGAGIFRPEVTEPMGIKVPVIAWGLGIDRMFMIRHSIEDVRYIFSQDLEWLRGQRLL